MDNPLIALHIDVHFKVNALENDLAHKAGQHTHRRRHNLHILRADNHLHRLIGLEAAVHTGKVMPAEVDKEVAQHNAVHDVGVTDEAGDKGVLGFVINCRRT